MKAPAAIVAAAFLYIRRISFAVTKRFYLNLIFPLPDPDIASLSLLRVLCLPDVRVRRKPAASYDLGAFAAALMGDPVLALIVVLTLGATVVNGATDAYYGRCKRFITFWCRIQPYQVKPRLDYRELSL